MIPDELTTGYRALCIGTMLLRGRIEHDYQTGDGQPAIYFYRDHIAAIRDWVEEEGIDAYFSENESDLFTRQVGGWHYQDIINMSWRAEALGVVLWAIQVMDELPSFDSEFEPAQLLAPLRLLAPTGDFFKLVRLRPSSTLQAARDMAELWHWRARTAIIQERGLTPPDGWTFPEIIRLAAEHAYENGSLPYPIGEDFPAFGKPFAELTPDELSRITSIALERHYSLNWLCGRGDNWDCVPTDT